MFVFPNQLYPITDMQLSGLSHAEQVAQLAEGGARLIQIREKHLTPQDFFKEAEAAIKVARAKNIKVVINDRVDIALALKADGVHLGQDDMPPEAARELLGPDAIIGFSTHSPRQAQLASTLPISYLALGPVFATSSKVNPDPVVGLDGLRLASESVGNLPIVAIGGITRENAAEVIAAGADAVAVISALYEKPTGISALTQRFLSNLTPWPTA